MADGYEDLQVQDAPAAPETKDDKEEKHNVSFTDAETETTTGVKAKGKKIKEEGGDEQSKKGGKKKKKKKDKKKKTAHFKKRGKPIFKILAIVFFAIAGLSLSGSLVCGLILAYQAAKKDEQ